MISESTLTNNVIKNLEIDASDFQRFKVYENLNLAQIEIINSLPVAFFANINKTSEIDLTENVAKYDWPDDFVRYIAIWVSYENEITDVNEGNRASEFDREKFTLNFQRAGTKGYPFIDLDAEGGFYISPAPENNQGNGIRIRYIKKPQDIASGVNSELDSRFQALLEYKATALSAMVENRRPDLHDRFDAHYKSALKVFLPKGV